MSREVCMLPGKSRSDNTDVLAASAAFFCAVSHGTQGEPSVSVSFLLLFISFIKEREYGFFSDSMYIKRINPLLEPKPQSTTFLIRQQNFIFKKRKETRIFQVPEKYTGAVNLKLTSLNYTTSQIHCQYQHRIQVLITTFLHSSGNTRLWLHLNILTVYDGYVTVEESQMLWFLWFMCLVVVLQLLKYIVVSSLKKDTHLFAFWTNSSLSVPTAE